MSAADIYLRKERDLMKKTPENSEEILDVSEESFNEDDAAARVDEIMKKYDRESNVRVWTGIPKILVSVVLVSFSLFCLYIALFSKMSEHVRLPLFMAYIMFIGFLVFPAKKGKQRVNYIPWYDIIIMLIGSGGFLYSAIFHQKIINQSLNIEIYELILGILLILILGELCRRAMGVPILIVAGVLVAYALIYGFNPTFLGRLQNLVHTVVYAVGDGGGIMTAPIVACVKFIVVFIIFGAFLERTGISDFFIQAANLVVGRFSGGPAKVAVVASALEGMVSGSSVANTVGSGAVTIPLMKKTGYKPEFAAAAEASASTGGQIMPPILGAAAFLIADSLGVGYGRVILASILPALLYFLGVFITVHLEAKKNKLRGLTKSELPNWRPIVAKIYLLIPICLLISLISVVGYTVHKSAAWAIVAVIVVVFISKYIYSLRTNIKGKNERLTFKSFVALMGKSIVKPCVEIAKTSFEALAAGAQGTIAIAAACGVAGIISGVITATGLGDQILGGVIRFSGGNIFIALFLTMLCCIVLGMGVPTTANYIIMSSICAPILVQMGISPIAAHFFVFYFGIVADLTPPVALAAYAGAAIAQSNPMKTAIQSTKLAIAAFIVPYVFALNPIMLFENVTSVFDMILVIVTAIVGIFGISAALEGYMTARMNVLQRIMSAVGGILLIIPGWVTDVSGIVLVSAVIVWQIIQRSVEKKKLTV